MPPDQTTDREYRHHEAPRRIVRWSKARPTSVFPEPDEESDRRAHEILTAHGMTLDRLSPAAMRHVPQGAGKGARDALL